MHLVVTLTLAAILVVTAMLLLRQRRKLRLQLRNRPAGQLRVRISRNGTIVAAEGSCAEVLGYSAGELVGLDVEILMPARIAAEHDQYVQRFSEKVHAQDGESRVVARDRIVTARHRDGSEFPVILCVRPLWRAGELLFDGVLHRIPEAGGTDVVATGANQTQALDWQWLRQLAHEIRTPMMAIQGHAEILAEPDASDRNRASSAHAILESCHHMIDLLGQLLDHARRGSDDIPDNTDRCSVRKLVDCVRSMVEGSADRKGLVLRVYVDRQVPATVLCDELRVRQILLNLLGNAIKFTDAGFVHIDVGLASGEAPMITFEVSDSGAGIASAFLPALFEPFRQEERTRKSGVGTGLGLSICRQLARRMNGELRLVETAPGGGSRFRLELPLRLPTDVPDKVRKHSENALNGKRILVVDDTEIVLRVTQRFLSAAGADVLAFQNSKEALRTLERDGNTFDCVVLDLMMPGVDGFEMARRLRHSGFDAPLIAFSAAGDDSVLSDCRDAGFDTLLTKPIGRERLVHAVAELIDAPA